MKKALARCRIHPEQASPRMRYTERRLPVGARVAVIGRARWRESERSADAGPGYRDPSRPARELTITSARLEPVVLTADPDALG